MKEEGFYINWTKVEPKVHEKGKAPKVVIKESNERT